MLRTEKYILIIVLLVCVESLNAVSLVYSMKLRRAGSDERTSEDHDKSEQGGKQKKTHVAATTLPIVYGRERSLTTVIPGLDLYEKSLTVGSLLFTQITTPKGWWIELSTAILNQNSHNSGFENFCDKRTGWDDFIVSIGKNLFFNKKKGFVTPYIIGGTPTKFKVSLQERYDALVGTRFFGLGAGTEFSYSFIKSLMHNLAGIVHVRCVHFFNRKWFPILPCNTTIQPGNLTDLFFITQYRYKRDVFEAGYNVSFYTNRSINTPLRDIPVPNITRNSFYFNVIHVFTQLLAFKQPGGVVMGFSIARAKTFNTKSFAWWTGLTLLF